MIPDEYFALRNHGSAAHENFKAPVYLMGVLKDRNARILDFGCGYGQMILALQNEGHPRIEGADINPVAIAHLRERGVVVHDLTCEPAFFESHAESYDQIILSHVLEHFPKDEIVPCLGRLRKLLKPGGSLIVMVPNAQSNTGAYWAYEDFTHHLLFTSGSIFFVLKAAGFSTIEFLDPDCTAALSLFGRMARRFLLSLYRLNCAFWNRVTSSSYHDPSPQIFSYEIKVKASV